MSWLAPIGFLGLIGLLALIVIYIIKPNYQNKVISSTFIWRLSLKYKKKRIPINKLKNILLFICQALILTICGLLLARPAIAADSIGNDREKVIIIDASASMMLDDGMKTRFERAVNEASTLAGDTLDSGASVSVILADASPRFIVQRAKPSDASSVTDAIDALLADGTACTYGSADMDAAFALAEEVLAYNDRAAVCLFTATEYIEKNGVIVYNVANTTNDGNRKKEWNAAILDCVASYNDNNHYEVSVDAGCFGETGEFNVTCILHSPNGRAEPAKAVRSVFFDPTEEEKLIVFTTDDFGGTPIYSFDYLEVYISADDSFSRDNSFLLYGGQKQVIRIQYASSAPNNFFAGIVRSLRETMKGKWDIQFVQKQHDEPGETEGFDFYIFEHRMPETMPTDGVVLLVDPTTAPAGSGLIVGDSHRVSSDSTLASGISHEVMSFVDPTRITIAKYNEIVADDGFDELAFYQGNPVMLLKDTDEEKVFVWAFDLNYSNIIAMPDFSFILLNTFNHFIPATMEKTTFEIGETVELTARGTELKLSGAGVNESFEGKSGSFVITTPGTYSVTQRPMQGDYLIIENFFAKVPSFESDVTKEVDSLPYLEVEKTTVTEYNDLLFYFAIALVTLMFAEWYLQTKKNY